MVKKQLDPDIECVQYFPYISQCINSKQSTFFIELTGKGNLFDLT